MHISIIIRAYYYCSPATLYSSSAGFFIVFFLVFWGAGLEIPVGKASSPIPGRRRIPCRPHHSGMTRNLPLPSRLKSCGSTSGVELPQTWVASTEFCHAVWRSDCFVSGNSHFLPNRLPRLISMGKFFTVFPKSLSSIEQKMPGAKPSGGVAIAVAQTRAVQWHSGAHGIFACRLGQSHSDTRVHWYPHVGSETDEAYHRRLLALSHTRKEGLKLRKGGKVDLGLFATPEDDTSLASHWHATGFPRTWEESEIF